MRRHLQEKRKVRSMDSNEIKKRSLAFDEYAHQEEGSPPGRRN